jgi:hypothetical protein
VLPDEVLERVAISFRGASERFRVLGHASFVERVAMPRTV